LVAHLKRARITVVAHVRTSGLADDLAKYLIPIADEVLLIRHSLVHQRPALSSYQFYRKGCLVKERQVEIHLPEIIRWMSDTLFTLIWSARFQAGSDAFIGLGALNAFAGLILKMAFVTRRSIYWAIDFSPRRFANVVLDLIFHTIDDLSSQMSDETWTVSKRIADAHKERLLGRLLRSDRVKRKIVPIGVGGLSISNKRRLPSRLIFIGHVLEKQGLQLAIEALGLLQEDFEDIDLAVIGDGPYLPDIRRLVSDRRLEKRVHFYGFIESDEEVELALSTACVGLAPYLPSSDSFSYYADPGKIKQYLANGLPVCVTNVPPTASALIEQGCVVIVEASAAGLAQGIRDILSDRVRLSMRRTECYRYMEGFTWDRIFDEAFGDVQPRRGVKTLR
jgi:glycosyltransferase involved in cell wall biosynthesis